MIRHFRGKNCLRRAVFLVPNEHYGTHWRGVDMGNSDCEVLGSSTGFFDVFPLFVVANCARTQNITFYEGMWTFCEGPSAKI